jgi:ABC-type multidrug transport system fused ATPase/permease subunit
VTEEAQKNHRRRTWLFACAGVILGFAGASAWGPKLVSLFFKPLEDSFSCSSSVNQALTQFMWLQLTLAVLGGVLALVVLFFWRRFMRQRAEAKQSRSASS